MFVSGANTENHHKTTSSSSATGSEGDGDAAAAATVIDPSFKDIVGKSAYVDPATVVVVVGVVELDVAFVLAMVRRRGTG